MADGDNGNSRWYIDQATGVSTFKVFRLGNTGLGDCFSREPGDFAWYGICCRYGQCSGLEKDQFAGKCSSLVLFSGDSACIRRQHLAGAIGVLILFRRDFLPEVLERKLNGLPLFLHQGFGPFQLDDLQAVELQWVVDRIWKELASSYPFKRELLLCLVLQVVHFVIKNFTSGYQSLQYYE
jgi:hypothetical protein